MTSTTTLPVNASVLALDSVVARIEANERQRRATDAVQVQLFAEALDQASVDHFLTLQAGRLVSGNDRAELAYRSIRAEIACAVGLSEQSVERRMAHAYALIHNYYETYLSLSEGEIGLAHTEVVVAAGGVIGEGTDTLTLARRGAYETAVLEHAVRETPARLRPIARRLAEQWAERTLDERHVEACRQRRVWVVDREDGMSDLTAHLPSVEAHAIFDRLTRASRVLAGVEQRESHEQQEPGEIGARRELEPPPSATSDADGDPAAAHSETRPPAPASSSDAAPVCRSRDELRTDIFTELLRTGLINTLHLEVPTVTEVPVIDAHVQVFITDETLFTDQLRIEGNRNRGGTSDRGGELDLDIDLEFGWGAPTSLAPAELAGSGPIDTATARTLAASATHWELVRQYPGTGAVISVDRYRPSEQMRRILGARDLHCRFPGCRAPLHRCDLDHTIDAQHGGPTSTSNLAHLCRGHHTLKHHGGWKVTQTNGGVLHWESPAGRIYTDRPPSKVRFMTPASSMTKHRHPEDSPPGQEPPGQEPFEQPPF